MNTSKHSSKKTADLNMPLVCMIPSNVFGSITANNLGYSKVTLEETIAKGDKECKVIVHFYRTDEAQATEGKEYFNLVLHPYNNDRVLEKNRVYKTLS